MKNRVNREIRSTYTYYHTTTLVERQEEYQDHGVGPESIGA